MTHLTVLTHFIFNHVRRSVVYGFEENKKVKDKPWCIDPDWLEERGISFFGQFQCRDCIAGVVYGITASVDEKTGAVSLKEKEEACIKKLAKALGREQDLGYHVCVSGGDFDGHYYTPEIDVE